MRRARCKDKIISPDPTTSSKKINSVTMSWYTSAQAQTEVINLARCTWEEAEKLGDKATKAPVLYTNTCFPRLKEDYPIWEDRLQVIYGLWRKLRLEQKVFYAEKARQNRDLFQDYSIWDYPGEKVLAFRRPFLKRNKKHSV